MSKYEQFNNEDGLDGDSSSDVGFKENGNNNDVGTEFEEVNEINFEEKTIENGKPHQSTEFEIPEIETVKSFKNGGY